MKSTNQKQEAVHIYADVHKNADNIEEAKQMLHGCNEWVVQTHSLARNKEAFVDHPLIVPQITNAKKSCFFWRERERESLDITIVCFLAAENVVILRCWP